MFELHSADDPAAGAQCGLVIAEAALVTTDTLGDVLAAGPPRPTVIVGAPRAWPELAQCRRALLSLDREPRSFRVCSSALGTEAAELLVATGSNSTALAALR
jgi:hypothetical protein